MLSFRPRLPAPLSEWHQAQPEHKDPSAIDLPTAEGQITLPSLSFLPISIYTQVTTLIRGGYNDQ